MNVYGNNGATAIAGGSDLAERRTASSKRTAVTA